MVLSFSMTLKIPAGVSRPFCRSTPAPAVSTLGVVDRDPLVAERNDGHDRIAGATRIDGPWSVRSDRFWRCMISDRDQRVHTRKGNGAGRSRVCLRFGSFTTCQPPAQPKRIFADSQFAKKENVQ